MQLLRAEWKQLQDSMPEKPALASAVADGPFIDQPVFMRGSLQAPGEVVSKHFPIVLAGEQPEACERERTAGTRRVACRSRTILSLPSDGESHLAMAFWGSVGPNAEQLGPNRRAADPSRTAGLPGEAIHR